MHVASDADADLLWRNLVNDRVAHPLLKWTVVKQLKITFKGRKDFWLSTELKRIQGDFGIFIIFDLTPGRLAVYIDPYRIVGIDMVKPHYEPMGLSEAFGCDEEEDLFVDVIPKMSKQMGKSIQKILEKHAGLCAGLASSVAKCAVA